MPKFLKDILTGVDGEAYSAAKAVGLGGAVLYLVFWTLQVWHSWAFLPSDAMGYAGGLGTVLGAMEGAVVLKSKLASPPQT